MRNDLIFDLTGGCGPDRQRPTSSRSRCRPQNQQVIVDITTARADVQQFGINASYTLAEIATGKVVVTGQTFARVSYDIPASSSASPARAASATPRTAPPR